MWHYVDGEYFEDHEAKLPVADRGFLYGDGCWESIGIWEGRLIHLDDHLARLYRNIRMLKLAFTMPREELRALVLEAAARNDMVHAPGGVMRAIVTRGSGGEIGLGLAVGEPSLVIMTMRRGDEAPERWRGGGNILRAVMSTYFRPPSTVLEGRIKSLSYLTSALADIEAQERGADLAILRNTLGYVAEGHAMNVVAVRGDTVLVPAETDGGLAGVTRGRVIETARAIGVPCVERNLTAYDFVCADEAFITSASAGIRPIGSIDGLEFDGPVPGPVTSRLHAAYIEAAYEDGTPVPRSGQT